MLYAEILKRHVAENPPNYGSDANSILEMAEAFYGVPEELKAECRNRLPDDLLEVLQQFDACLLPAEE